MANWFKFSENDIDEPRLQYAIGELPEVLNVWLLILSECCRHRSGLVKWSQNQYELLGYSRRLNVTVPKINEAIRLLKEILYVEQSADSLKVLKWNDKQGDYLTRKQRGDYANRTANKRVYPRVSDIIGESPTEERRGEEIRIDQKESTHTVASLPRKQFKAPSVAEVKLQSAKVGLPDLEAEKFWNYYESNGWRVGRNPMRSWTHALVNWKNNLPNYGHANGSKTDKPNPRNDGVCRAGPDYGAAAKAKLLRQQNEGLLTGMATPMAGQPPSS